VEERRAGRAELRRTATELERRPIEGQRAAARRHQSAKARDRALQAAACAENRTPRIRNQPKGGHA
ncbi:MAG: hypothetical protein KGI35_03805, partial [Burkholderiales bacterium]|nr:hypothetical protein [Burkholderiales bacterium]